MSEQPSEIPETIEEYIQMIYPDWRADKHENGIVAVDVDGVIYEQVIGSTIDYGPIIDGASEILYYLYTHGWYVLINSARVAYPFFDEEAIQYLSSKLISDGIKFNRIWAGRGKPPADVYIDDRNVLFEGDWLSTGIDVRDFEVYWKREDADVRIQVSGMRPSVRRVLQDHQYSREEERSRALSEMQGQDQEGV